MTRNTYLNKFNIIANEEINAVIVSGDVYDKSIPAVEAVTVFDDFLTELPRKIYRH